jgi:sortase (surface protein transpeptidase)
VISAGGGARARPFARAAVALLMVALIAGLALFGAGRLPGQSVSPLGRWLGQGRSQSASAPAVGGGPRVVASGGRPASTPDAGTRAAEQALTAPAAPPTELVIPSLSVAAVVEAVGVAADGTMAVPAQADHVAWYQPGVMPGDAGNALFDGHLDWWTGPAVFWHLANLHIGDQVNVVRADGSQLAFMVDSTSTYPWNSRPDGLFTTAGPPSISLVTCSGSWDRQRQTYLSRLVVHATLAAAAPQQTPGDEGG